MGLKGYISNMVMITCKKSLFFGFVSLARPLHKSICRSNEAMSGHGSVWSFYPPFIYKPKTYVVWIKISTHAIYIKLSKPSKSHLIFRCDLVQFVQFIYTFTY